MTDIYDDIFDYAELGELLKVNIRLKNELIKMHELYTAKNERLEAENEKLRAELTKLHEKISILESWINAEVKQVKRRAERLMPPF